MSKKMIYIVDDEKHIQELIKYNLEENGYDVMAFDSGEALLEECMKTVPDLFVLDIMLPGIDGLETCKRIKANHRLAQTPVLMLSAKSEEFDRIIGLELGADDYITKPFSIREFITRVKVAFRRNAEMHENKENIIQVGKIKIDFVRHEVYKGDTLIEMTLKEFQLLRLMILNKGKVLARDTLLEKVWGFDYYGESRTVDVHIRFLRQKIEDDDTRPVYIETVRGIGYRFSDKEGRSEE